MYQLSRSLYRDLTPMLAVPAGTRDGRADRQDLLETCEAAVRRMVFEPDSYARPARALFGQIRHMFPVDAQADVWSTVRVHTQAAGSLASRLETMLRRDCQAFSRRGAPCRREATLGGRYCPSHKHLDEQVPLQASA